MRNVQLHHPPQPPSLAETSEWIQRDQVTDAWCNTRHAECVRLFRNAFQRIRPTVHGQHEAAPMDRHHRFGTNIYCRLRGFLRHHVDQWPLADGWG
jgi:hypothetical protein